MTDIPSDDEAWAAIARVDGLLGEARRSLHPSQQITHAPDPNGNAVCDPHARALRRRVVHTGSVTCGPCATRLAADGWEALEEYARDQGWDEP